MQGDMRTLHAAYGVMGLVHAAFFIRKGHSWPLAHAALLAAVNAVLVMVMDVTRRRAFASSHSAKWQQ